MSIIITPDFFEQADHMRSEFDALVGAERIASITRCKWDYWHIPGQYSYMRTYARNFFSPLVYQSFSSALSALGNEYLGCPNHTQPWLSYYIDNCCQEFHTDVVQGSWAFVYSLTRWEQRRFSGGETMLLAPKTLDYWSGFESQRSLERGELLELIPPKFNQLTIFDPRVPHGVSTVHGTHDPLDSRVVLHGWFTQPGMQSMGVLKYTDSEPVTAILTADWAERRKQFGKLHGILTLRINVNAGGMVSSVKLIACNLVSLEGKKEAVDQAVQFAIDLASRTRFPTGNGVTIITLPFKAEDQ